MQFDVDTFFRILHHLWPEVVFALNDASDVVDRLVSLALSLPAGGLLVFLLCASVANIEARHRSDQSLFIDCVHIPY